MSSSTSAPRRSTRTRNLRKKRAEESEEEEEENAKEGNHSDGEEPEREEVKNTRTRRTRRGAREESPGKTTTTATNNGSSRTRNSKKNNSDLVESNESSISSVVSAKEQEESSNIVQASSAPSAVGGLTCKLCQPQASKRGAAASASSSSNHSRCYASEAELNAHYVHAHIQERIAKLLPSAAPFKCPVCPASKGAGAFKSKSALLEHFGNEHGSTIDQMVAEEMQKKYNGDSGSQEKAGEGEANADSAKEDEEAKSRLRCKLCKATAPDRPRLKKHAIDKHFKEEICKELPSKKPLLCPAAECRFDAPSFLILYHHYLAVHDVGERFMPRVEEEKVENGETADKDPLALEEGDDEDDSKMGDEQDNDSGDAADSEDSSESDGEASKESREEDVIVLKRGPGRPRKKVDKDAPKTMVEFRKQVQENLRTQDGNHAEAVDERTIKCVCGKMVRLCNVFYWKYMVQKPNVKNGVVIQKGHWFTCPVVLEKGSVIPQYQVSQQDLEASKQQSSSSKRSVSSSRANSDNESEASTTDQPLKRRSRRVIKKAETFDSEDFEPERKRSKVESSFSIERHIRELLQTRTPGELFLQDGPCFEMGYDVPMCRMCKQLPYHERREMLIKGVDEDSCDISCCFYGFRKLRYTKSGSLSVRGYLDPREDPTRDEFALWQTNVESPPSDLTVEKVKYILSLIGDQFCDMVQQESKCLSIHMSENKSIVWKPAVKGVREMCDVCKTTLFNYHWMCNKCGMFICLDCYQFRRSGLVKDHSEWKLDDTDEYDWPLCNSGEGHLMERLLMAQIIPGSVLMDMAKKIHEARERWGITQFCHRPDEIAKLMEEGLFGFGVSL